MPDFLSRLERFPVVDSTQLVVRGWMEAGTAEVSVAVADEQTVGRGRQGREWIAPPGAALLASVGFRPVDLAPRHAWRLAAITALAMLDAAGDAAGLRDETLALKWPNDLVTDGPGGELRKVAGVLGEVTLAGDRIAGVIVGIGINVDWRARDFPPDLATSMTSLLEASGGRPVEREALLDGWLARLEPRYEALRAGAFDSGTWSTRQRTTGRLVEVDIGGEIVAGMAAGVDPETGSLLVETTDADRRSIGSGEVVRCRIVALPRPGGR